MDELEVILNNMSSKKATGSDGIPIIVIQRIWSSIGSIFTSIVNGMLRYNNNNNKSYILNFKLNELS
jgi:hypothetical protein